MENAIFAFSASISLSKSGLASSSGNPAFALIWAKSFFALSNSSTNLPTKLTSDGPLLESTNSLFRFRSSNSSETFSLYLASNWLANEYCLSRIA